jgi:hypothetical protein
VPTPGTLSTPVSPAPGAIWYVEMKGERTGPYPWALIVELVALGALTCDDKLGTALEPAMPRVAEFLPLLPTLQLARASAAHASEPPRMAASPSRASSATPYGRRAGFIGGGIWAISAITYLILSALSWPGILDGLLLARLQAFGALFLSLFGAVMLAGLWRSLKGRNTRGAGCIRIGSASLAFMVLLLLLSMASNAPALFLTAIGHDPMGSGTVHLTADGELELKGAFSAGVAAQAQALLVSHPAVKTLHLNSPGGWVREGVLLATVVQSHHLATDSNTGCYSACIIAYLSGSPRRLHPEARLGFHSSSGLGTDAFYLHAANDEVAQRLRNLGVAETFIDRALTTPASALWTPDPAELVANHLVDEVSTDYFADSGEALDRMAVSALRQEAAYPFLAIFSAQDGRRFSSFDHSLRLSLRRSATAAELDRQIGEFEQSIKSDRLARVEDSAAAQAASSLYQAADQQAQYDPAQCVNTLTNLVSALNWSHQGTLTLGAIVNRLLQSPSRSADAAPAQALREAESDASLLLAAEKPAEQCHALLRLYQQTLTDPALGARLVRVLNPQLFPSGSK